MPARGRVTRAMEGGRVAQKANGGAVAGGSSPSPSRPAGGGAAKYLADLPSRGLFGLFSSTVTSSNPGGMRVYICDRDTAPPAEQLIQTDQTNILIRSLTLKKQKNESSAKDSKVKGVVENTKGKRAAERSTEGRNSAKKANLNNGAGASKKGGSSALSSVDLQCLTVEKLRALLKERGLATKGKKDELIARLRDIG